MESINTDPHVVAICYEIFPCKPRETLDLPIPCVDLSYLPVPVGSNQLSRTYDIRSTVTTGRKNTVSAVSGLIWF